MVACAKFPVDYQATTLSTRIQTIGPIVTFAGPPPDQYQPNALGFAGQFNGINQLVCTYIRSSPFTRMAKPDYRQLRWCSSLRRLLG